VEPITLPFPPSTNRLWRVVNGRSILSKCYRDWMAGLRNQRLFHFLSRNPQCRRATTS
jgi:hypothetical protein